MADSVEMQDIRGLDIDKLAKGFADEAYIFKNECTVAPMSGDSIRWFQKTAGTLTAGSPASTKNVSPLSNPTTLEVTWTRNVSYPKKYFVEGFISMEDIKGAEVDVLATTVRDLTRVIARDVDADIWDVMTESQTVVNIQTVAVSGGWDEASFAATLVADIMEGKRKIWEESYNPEGATLFVNPYDYSSIVTWLIEGKGSSIPGFSSEKITSGVVINLLGVNLKVSNNVTTDFACMMVPKVATTFRQQFPITAKTVQEEGIGTRVRIYEHGIAYNTDPKAIVLYTNTKA